MTKGALVTTNDPKRSRLFIKLTVHVDVPPEAVPMDQESPIQPEEDRLRDDPDTPDQAATKHSNHPH